MNYSVKPIPVFERQAMRLIRKYPSLKKEPLELGVSLKQKPEIGIPLGNQCFKIRIAIASKGKGKSGGARIITHIQVTETTVYMLTIYDKTERPDITDKELDDLLKLVP